MEHGLYVLEGKAVYRLNQDWSRWRPATSCGCAPSARRPAIRAARGASRYLLCKDVNWHMRLTSMRRIEGGTG